jgi:hypothetical protein
MMKDRVVTEDVTFQVGNPTPHFVVMRLTARNHRKIGENMSTAGESLEHHASAAGHRDQATRHYHRASKLFEKDHAYAAHLVQIASAI